MEVRPGYRQTEVGVIPEEWGIQSLGSICDVRDGTHESPRFFKHGVPFITSKNIVDGRLDLEDVSYISENDAVDFDRRSKVDRHDILMSMIGTIGNAVLVDCEPNFCIKNVALLKPRNVVPPFLIQLINSAVFQRYLADNLDGGIQKFISLGTLRQLSIPLPNEHEQRAIAAALSDVDALIAKLDQLIAKKRDLKQAAMQQLLTGQTRLPGFSGEWEVKRLDELGAWRGGMTPSMQNPSYWLNGNVPWISSGDVKSVMLKETGFSITAFAVKQGTTTMLPAKSIVLVTRSGILRKYLPVAMNVIPMAINQDIKALIPYEKFCPAYLLHTLTWNGDRILARCMKAGTTVESVEFRWLKAFTVSIPSLPEQTAIATVLTDMDAEIAALEARRDKTRALKQGMMQELLTGRIRLV